MAYLYIIQQISSVLVLLRFRSLYAILSISLFTIIFIFKNDTYDLFSYTAIFASNASGYDKEPLFASFVRGINAFVADPRGALYVYQVLLLALVSSIIIFFRNNRLLILAVILSSVAVMLAVNNNLRQGTAGILILVALLSYLNGYKKTSILLCLSATGFHLSAPFFLAVVAGLGIAFKSVRGVYFSRKRVVMTRFYIIGFVFAMLAGFFLIFIVDYIRYSHYVGVVLTHGNERTPLALKVWFVFFALVVSEFILKFRSIDHDIDLFRFFRFSILSLVSVLSFSPNFDEIGGRILYFYFVLEMGLLALLISRRLYTTAFVIILSYAFATNVWNILGGL